MFRVLFAERAVLGHYKSVGIVLFVFNAVIVSMLAFGTFESNFGSCRFDCHNKTPYKKITPLFGAYNKFTILKKACQSFLKAFLHFFCNFHFFFIRMEKAEKSRFSALPLCPKGISFHNYILRARTCARTRAQS
jgi:hypothetical protein